MFERIRMLRLAAKVVGILCIMTSPSKPAGPSSSYIASSRTFRFFFSGTRQLRIPLISSTCASRRGLTAAGRGAAPDDEDRSDEGMISIVRWTFTGGTLRCNHEVAWNDIDTLWIHEQFIRAGVYLRIPSLNRVQSRLSTQRLNQRRVGVGHTLISAPAYPFVCVANCILKSSSSGGSHLLV
jgi:hypothetical protein